MTILNAQLSNNHVFVKYLFDRLIFSYIFKNNVGKQTAIVDFKYDIIIAYSGEDDVADGDNGWVSQYSSNLSIYLHQFLGYLPRILLLNEKTSNSIDDFSESAIFMPVLSNNFINSESCQKAFDAFMDHSQSDLRSAVVSESRIVKINLESVNEEEFPAKVRDQLGYDFYTSSSDTSSVKRFDTSDDKQVYTNDYWLRLTDVVYQCKNILNKISITSAESGGGIETSNGKVVYLAGAGSDLSTERSIIKRELSNHGYIVLPNAIFARGQKGLERHIQKDIDRADVYVQLVGNVYGEILTNNDISIAELEYNTSLIRAQSINQEVENKVFKKKFPRIIWKNSDIDETSFVQQKFIDRFSRESSDESIEILEGSIEELKAVVLSRLKPESLRQQGSIKENISNSQSVYLIVDREFESENNKIQNLLIEHGFDVTTSSYKGSVIQMLDDHQEKLKSCDSSLILYDGENHDWLSSKFKDILKAPGLGRGTPISTRAIISKGKIDNPLLGSSKAILIENTPEITSDSLKPFFQKMESVK